MAHELIEMGRRPALKPWKPSMGQHQIKGFPQAGTAGLSILGALAAVGIDCTMNKTKDQIAASPTKTNDLVRNILPSFAVTTAVAGATWWLSGSKTAAFVIESVGLLYFVPKLVALFE